jgi:hypothetical protein
MIAEKAGTWSKLKAWAKDRPDEVLIMGSFALMVSGSVAALIWNHKQGPKRAAEIKKMVEELEYAAVLRQYILDADAKINDELVKDALDSVSKRSS